MRFEEIKAKIYPWIKVVYKDEDGSLNSTSTLQLTEEDSPIYQDWLGDLAIFYVVDEKDRFELILNRDMPPNMTIKQLHEIAITNLERDVEFSFNKTVFDGYGLIAGGDHEAGALCLDDIWHWCSDQLKDDLVVAVPAKDMIMMVPASDSKKIDSLKKFVIELFKDGDRLLTKQLFLFEKKKNAWTVLEKAE